MAALKTGLKVMIVGSDKVYSIENYYQRYLEELGVEVRLFVAQAMFYDYYQKGIVNKILFKLGISGIIRKINRLFEQELSRFKPDIVWVFKGMEIFPSSLESARRTGTKLVNYNPDNPFIFTGKGSGNDFVTDSIRLYHLHLTYNLDIQRRLVSDFSAKTVFLPFGFDVSEALYRSCAEQEEVVRVCFLGNPDAQRAAFLHQLLDAGVEIDLYGNDWQHFVRHSGARISGPVYGDELWRVLARYRVQLNLMRIHNEHSHNMRSFEVPGIGGIMLAPDTPEHRDFFTDGEEVFLYSDVQSCLQKARLLLNMTRTEANQVRERARRRSVGSGYSYRDRAGFVLEKFMDLHAG